MTRDRPRIALAINPAASFGAHALVGHQVAALFSKAGVDVNVLVEPDAVALRRTIDDALLSNPDALVVVGGDGLVHLAVNALAGSAVPLGIVPTGTGNDLARGLGIPVHEPDAAVKRVLSALRGEPTLIDIGVVQAGGSERRFAGVVSAGFDARVNERANTWTWPKGRARYIIALLRELIGLRANHYTLRLDGRQEEKSAVILSLANNAYMGGGMAIAPHASLHDGQLDVAVVEPLSRLRLLRLFPRVFTGAHLSVREVSVVRARRVELDADSVIAYADGERIGPLPITVTVSDEALTVLA